MTTTPAGRPGADGPEPPLTHPGSPEEADATVPAHEEAAAGGVESVSAPAADESGTSDEDDGSVPDKQIWRWKDDGGAISSPS